MIHRCRSDGQRTAHPRAAVPQIECSSREASAALRLTDRSTTQERKARAAAQLGRTGVRYIEQVQRGASVW